MQKIIQQTHKILPSESIVLLVSDIKNLDVKEFTKEETAYIKEQHRNEKKLVILNRFSRWMFIQFFDKEEKETYKRLELCRKAGDSLLSFVNDKKIKTIVISDEENKPAEALAFAEGMALGNYQFLKYKTDAGKKASSLTAIKVHSKKINASEVDTLNIIVDAIYQCRTLINEPVSYLNAVKLSEEIQKMFKDTSVKVEVMNKSKIKSLKMGGLLAVNQGSIDPPTFTTVEWKPSKAVNKKPYVFVGKGLVYDTGGLSLKPSNSMTTMKSDMSGAAAAAAAIYCIAKAKLPVHVVGIMPATDNRPDGNAYVPDDIVKMYDGTNVEVLNTDAEGRMILADALSYAKKYNPELVIDLATLTGSASIAIGKYGIVAMGSDCEKEFDKLKQSGLNVYERIAEFPFWDEYDELIKSDIADIKNVGGRDAGAITAGKFLKHFTDYPWIHLDIAGPAFVEKKDSYRGAGGTGVGVRLLFDFIKNKCR